MSWSPPPSPGPREGAGSVLLGQTSTPLPREHGVSKRQHPALQVVLPATPSAPVLAQGEISFTPPPRSPAAASAGELSPRTTPHHAPDGTSSDKSSETALGGRLSRKESYKAQRQHYRKEKKRAASALLSSIEDTSVVVLADWLKVRGSLKSWTKLWCVLKPGLLLLYKSSKAKSSHWVGTVLLSACEVIERPSKKDGFCFKLYHPLEQSIWAPRGPHNETIGAVVQPLPTAHLIFRAPSQAAGHCWLDGLELALRCTNSMLRCRPSGGEKMTEVGGPVSVVRSVGSSQAHASHTTQWSPEDLERHFNDNELEGEEQSEPEWDMDQRTASVLARLRQIYEEEPSDHVGMSGELIEEMAEENKNLLWFLIKQVRPGMDLSKVVLPTFILEPRSFLDKLSDNYYHADILASAVETEDPYLRFKTVLRWYLSGLYRKPKGLKKPYNPVLGEMFRCFWLHPGSGSRTYYIAEQVSHHPPVSAFYISNRKEGFIIEGSLLAKSKFHGNATSAILEGYGRVHLPTRGEIYCTTAPYAYCRGLVLGTLSMELGGKVTVACAQTGIRADVEFKLKGFLGGAEQTNAVSGRIRKGKETLAHIDGYWDGRIDIKDKQTGEEGVFLDVAVLKMQRLKRYLVNMDEQQDFESQKLWAKVSVAIANDDQIAATEQKTVVEEAQREKAKSGVIWVPRQFHPVDIQAWSCSMATEGQAWQYNHANTESWSEHECLEYEENFVIQSVMRETVARRSLTSFTDGPTGPPVVSRRSEQAVARRERESDRSDTESGAEMQTEHQRRRHYKDISSHNLKKTLAGIETALRDQTRAIESLRRSVVSAPVPRYQTHHTSSGIAGINTNLVAGVIVALIVQMTLKYFFY